MKKLRIILIFISVATTLFSCNSNSSSTESNSIAETNDINGSYDSQEYLNGDWLSNSMEINSKPACTQSYLLHLEPSGEGVLTVMFLYPSINVKVETSIPLQWAFSNECNTPHF
ncbi:MAG: hypothetical protein H6605_00080 [Flavobacteriales bacterium]|nr:hypothetical protein [Flavobacteriales bacterium]